MSEVGGTRPEVGLMLSLTLLGGRVPRRAGRPVPRQRTHRQRATGSV